MHDALARQMRRQRAASRLLMLLVFAFVGEDRGGRCHVGSRFVLGHALLQFGELQLQLIEQFPPTLG